MADKIFHSTAVTFVDMTDSRTLDVYISSNHPTVQLCDTNKTPLEYNPDWSATNLKLESSFYLDSTPITPETIEWYTKIGTTETLLDDFKNKSTLSITANALASNPIITYICKATYDTLSAFKEITFVRVDTGLDGKSGSSAPVVQAQYSVDGKTGWTSVLNAATHKYIRYSYDGGKTWTTEIKMVGEDGTSVKIKGTATSKSSVSGTSYYTLVYESATITGATIGDAYLLDGNLYVCVDSRDGSDYFMDVGHIRGPQGNDGQSSYVFIRYATDANGSNMSASPSSTTTHIGICTVNTNVAPTTASSYTWSKFVGDSAKSIVLSGDSQVFKVSTSNVYTPATIKVTAQAFNTSVTTWTYSTNGGQTFVSTAPTGVSINGNVVTITGSTLTTSSLVVKASDGTYSDVFTVYKAFDGTNGTPGTPGAPASMVFLTNENVTFSANASGVITSATISTNVVAYNGATKAIPTVGAIANLPTGMTATVGTVVNNEVPIVFTVTNSNLGSALNNNGSITIPVNGPVYTNLILTWSKVNSGVKGDKGDDGSDAYTVLLTNESHVFAGDVQNAVAGTAETQALAYIGTTPQTVKIISVNEKTAAITDTDTGIDGLKFKCDTLSGTSPKITFTCTTAFKSASGTIPIKLSVGGVEFIKMFTYSIAFKGATGGTGGTGPKGDAATAYWLVSSASVVNKTSTGTIAVTPSTLTFTGKSQTGTNAPIDYACRWIIAYSTDGMNYTNLYTSTANEASKSITVATTYKTVRTRMYMAGGTTALIDEQIIPVVSDGATGPKGVGVKSTTVTYGVSDSASTKPADTAWQSTIPTVAEGKYLWTRTIIDYTDDAIADTVTYTYAKQGSTGAMGPTGSSGTSVTVKSIKYQSGTSATTAPTGTWSDSVVAVAEGNYLWTQTTFSDNKVAYGVAKQGQKGDTGRGISKITEYYLATTAASGVTTATSGWTPAVQTIDTTKKYLWNYELITYTDNATSTTTPVIIGVFGNTGNTGKGIKSVTEYYLASTASSGVTTSTSGWKDTMQTLTSTNKYLWNYELITYTDNSTATISPVIIGVYGDQGIQGIQGPKGNDAYTVMLTNESHIFAGDVSNAIAGSTTTQVLAYNGSTAQTVTIVSVNSKTAATADTDTGIAGLKFKCSALSGASPTITFTCTTSFVSKSGTIPIVLSVGGVSFTKMFTYSIAFKGATGNPGNPGSPGTPASLVDITPSALYFKSTTGKDGTFTPDYIYLYPRFQTVTYSKWEYSTNGGTSWTTVTSGSNGLTIGTYNSVAYSLQIAKNSALYTDTVTSISFRCVSSNSAVYDTVSIAKIYDVVDLQIGGRNYILNSANLSVSGLGSAVGSSMEYKYIDVGQSYMNIASGTEVIISFDLEMTVNTANPVLTVYNSNRLGPKMISYKSIQLTGAVGSTIKRRCSVVTQITDRENPTLTNNSIEFYSTYGTSNWFKITNLKLEVGNKATDWSPAPEDLKSTTFQLYAPKGYLITNDVPEVTLETFAYDGSQPITGATFVWSRWNGEAWIAISGATDTSLTLNKSNVLKSVVYKCEMTYGGQAYTATATVEDKTDVYDSLIHITSKYSSTNRLYWVLYSTVYSEEGERDELLGPISTTAPLSPTAGSYWYKVDETNYTVTLMKYSGTAWAATTDKQELVYDWFLLNDVDKMITLGAQSKVKIVTANDFSRTCSVQCNVSDAELILLTHNNQILTDPSDPIISATAPTNPINGQLWIKTNANGSYVLSVWDSASGKWVVSEADTQNKVYVTKPTQYNAGDLWIVDSNYQPVAYDNGVVQTYKHPEKTMLRATATSQTYSDAHWVEALKYQKELDNVVEDVEKFKQFMSIDDTGLIMQAKGANGSVSEFKTVLTNTELGFYQGASRVAYINNNQLNISKAEITNGMVVSGTTPELQIGNFVLIQESNGSLSIGLKS